MPRTTFFFLFVALLATSNAFTTLHSQPRTKNNIPLNFSPTDIADGSSFILAKYDAKTIGLGVAMKKVGAGSKMLDPDVQAQFLSDSSHVLMDIPEVLRFEKKNELPDFLKKVKTPSKLQMRYANVLGRIMILGIGFLPNHGYSPEEMAVQLLLLGVSMKPVIRSIQLYRCISKANRTDECELEPSDQE
jgi:hypothetical protein